MGTLVRPSVCGTCPYKRSSPRGNTTFVKDTMGDFAAARALIRHAEAGLSQDCHTDIIGKKEPHLCKGSTLFFENNDKPCKHPEFFNNIEEFETHHIWREGFVEETLMNILDEPPVKRAEAQNNMDAFQIMVGKKRKLRLNGGKVSDTHQTTP